MVLARTPQDQSSCIQSALQRIVNIGINGMDVNGRGVLKSAEAVAEDYLSKSSSVEEAINSLIAWKTTQAASTGFITGLGGLITLPVSIPASLLAYYTLGANTAAAIAHLRGHNLNSDRVKTIILLCLLGKSAESILKEAGITIGTKITQNLIQKIPGKVLIEINKKIGFRLITKAGKTGVINLTNSIPFLGGLIGGSCDGLFVKGCGEAAKRLFVQKKTGFKLWFEEIIRTVLNWIKK